MSRNNLGHEESAEIQSSEVVSTETDSRGACYAKPA